MGHTFSKILVHVIFSTKGRRQSLYEEMRSDLVAYLCGIARNEGAQVVAGAAVRDHVHLVMQVKPSHALSDLVRTLKANSSRWIHEKFADMHDFAWQSGFAVFSVSASGLEDAARYVANQEIHHRAAPFAEELRSFLERHGVEFDPAHYLD